MSIDLHLHTTASDGQSTPAELVERIWRAGIRAFSVTDHDTRAGEQQSRAAAARLGMEFIPGIEITSVHGGRDVHLLAYNLPPDVPELDALIADQRRLRVERAMEIAERLARLGAPIDVAALVAEAAGGSGKAVARPHIARCLMAAGHVSSVPEAFDRYLSEDSPAYVPHRGASPAAVVALVVRHGGVASFAHPGYTKKDDLIPGLVDAGLQCLEAFHSEHDAKTTEFYLEVARRHGIAVSGGSDYHGEGARRARFLGVTTLPPVHYERFRTLLES